MKMQAYRRWICGGVLIGTMVNVGGVRNAMLFAQQAPTPTVPSVVADKPSAEAIIAEEPKYIDPLELVSEALRVPITHNFQDVTLNEVADWIQSETGLNVVLDESALEADGVSPSQPLSETMNKVPLYQFLDRLERIGFGWSFEGGLITLGSPHTSLRNVQYNISLNCDWTELHFAEPRFLSV